jgi:RNA polymerase sigma-70 factor (ECF subfamily)
VGKAKWCTSAERLSNQVFWRRRPGRPNTILVCITGGEKNITQLLGQLRAGDANARGELMEVVYPALRRIAQWHLRRERSGHTLQPTALVNEAYLKLFGRSEVQFADRAHFFALVSQVMRRVLVDHARARAAARRSGDGQRVSLEAALAMEPVSGETPVQLLELDRALDALAHENRTLAELIEMRYFGGMTAEESAEVLGRSVHVVRHELRLAHAWLKRELTQRS